MQSEKYLPEGSLIGTKENIKLISSAEGLEKAIESEIILEAVAEKCDENLNLTVDLGGGIEGIIPRSEIQYCMPGEEMREIAAITRVGKAVCFKVMKMSCRGGKIVAYLSRRAAQEECRERFTSLLVPGDIIEAKVTHLENFGAFIDIGCGLVSLLSIDCISVSRISPPRDRLFIGERIPVVVTAVDRDGETPGRIYVSHKELLGTWEENAARFTPGQTVSGIVRGVESYGIFVELAPNLTGLAEYRPDIEVGQTAAVYIKSIIPEKSKIKLVLIDSYKGEPPSTHTRFDFESLPKHVDFWRYSNNSPTRYFQSYSQNDYFC